jgi:hypothetical protein
VALVWLLNSRILVALCVTWSYIKYHTIIPSNASVLSWDEEYAMAAILQPEDPQFDQFVYPGAGAARYLVAELPGFQENSPTLTVETITALSKSQVEATSKLPSIIVEEHQPGINDLMTGAINPSLQARRTQEELVHITKDDNNAVICRFDFRCLDNFMPYKLFDASEIAKLDILHVPENINRLPSGFHTTTLGLKKVWIEIWHGQAEAVYGDGQLLTELAKVGGAPRQDLVPCTSEDEWDNDHRIYWKMMSDLRTSWGEEEEEAQREEYEHFAEGIAGSISDLLVD